MPAFLTVLSVILAFAVSTQSTDTPGSRFRQIADYRTISADFVQIRYLAELNMKVEIKGRMASEKNGRLRWQVFSPVKSITVIGSRELKHWDGETGKAAVIRQDKFPWLGVLRDCMNDWLSGDPERLGSRFELTVKDAHTLRLRPKSGQLQAIFKAVEIHADAAYRAIESIMIEENSGDRLEIRFLQVRINPELPEKLWRMPPE